MKVNLKNNHSHWMAQAIKIAKKGIGFVSPNPPVGAVLVKNGKVIARGYHSKFGGPHAEIDAIQKAKEKAVGCDLYVTLEPCSTHGKTPPCTQAIIKAGIKRVFVGCTDPNSINRNKAKKLLSKNGIQLDKDILKKESTDLITSFIFNQKNKMPYVTLKAAQSLDGKIATQNGDSKWITSNEARIKSHELRLVHDAILVGINTIQKDDSALNIRLCKGKKETIKIILDTQFKIASTAKVFNNPGVVYILTSSKRNREEIEKKPNVKVLRVKQNNSKVDLRSALKLLYKNGIGTILVEGGGTVHAEFIKRRLCQAFYWFVAPKIIGGKQSIGSVAGDGITQIKYATQLDIKGIESYGLDFAVYGEFK